MKKSQNFSEAKSLFISYLGNSFFMTRSTNDGDFKKWSSFNVPENLKNQWREEYIQDGLRKLEKLKRASEITLLFSNCIKMLEGLDNTAYIFDFLNIAKALVLRIDTWSAELILNDLLMLSMKEGRYKVIKRIQWIEFFESCLEITNSLLRERLTIDSYYINPPCCFVNIEELQRRLLCCKDDCLKWLEKAKTSTDEYFYFDKEMWE